MPPLAARCVALLAALIPATAVAAGVPHMLVIAPPVVAGLSPAQVTAGEEAVLQLRGRALRDGLQASFGAGIAADPVGHASADGSQASLRIRVSADAAPGQHRLVLVLGVERLPQNVYLSVQSMRVIVPLPSGIHVEGQGAPGIMVPAAPVLTRVAPQSARAGSTFKLTLAGRGLRPGLRLDFGPGVHVESLRVLGPRLAAATVRIDASAAPGRRLPRASDAGTRVQVMPLAALQITGAPVKIYGTTPAVSAPAAPTGIGPEAPMGIAPAAPPGIAPAAGIGPLPAPARLDGITPNVLEAGRDYSVTAYGEQLAAGLELDLGAGVRIDSVDVLDSRRAQVSLHVDAGATPGLRHTRLRAGAIGPWVEQPATLAVQAPFHVTAMPRPKLPPLDWKGAIEGRILLKKPSWYSGLASKPPPKDPITGKPLGPPEVIKVGIDVPTVKDDTLFVWREQNPGLAEWYEVRFYAGDNLVATRTVKTQRIALANAQLLPTWLIPDTDLVAQLTQASGGPTVSRGENGGLRVNGTAQARRALGGQDNEMPASDLTWEVVGYRRYFQSGIEPHAALGMRRPVLLASLSGAVPPSSGLGTMVPHEVERSERWPLNTPARPTGLACGAEASSTLDVMDIDNAATSKSHPFSSQFATANHTGERWKMTGALDLGSSPWASDPQKSQSATGHHPKKVQSTTWRFDNVFVDWGDGTVGPLVVSQRGDPGDYEADTKMDFGAPNDMNPPLHAYSEVGTYTVRVYQLAEADIQSESAGNVSVAANPHGSLYATAQAAVGGGAGTSSGEAAPRGFRHAKATGKHAYMLLCKPVTISPRHDSAADGPLNLVAAKVRGFPEQPGDDTPPKGVKVGPAAPAQSSSGLSVPAGHAALAPRSIAQIFATGPGGEPRFSACDVALTGGGYIYYYGQGRVRLTWYVDGAPLGSSILPLGPSTPRSDQVLAGKNPGPPLVSASNLILSPPAALDNVGHHKLSFDAAVQYDARGLTALAGLVGQALGSGGRKPDRKLASQLAAGLHGAPPLGVLPPQGVRAPAGGDPVAWLDIPLRRVAQGERRPVLVAALGGAGAAGAVGLGSAFKSAASLPSAKPPAFVAAPARGYDVLGVKSDEPCTFHFPVQQGGEFVVGGLQQPGSGKPNVTHQGNVWSGSGKLFVRVANAAGGTVELPVPLKFAGWTLKDDAITVASGGFDLSDPLQSQLEVPGADATLLRLQGTAGDSVRMTLRATLNNPDILASADQSPPPPLTATAVLTPQGDWYAGGLSMPELSVYDSGFSVQPKSVALDLSASEGSGCGAGGNGWMGVAFGAGSRLDAYTFDLKKTQSGAVSAWGWGIDAQGLCGSETFGAYDSPVDSGTIHWDGIDAHAGGGAFSAAYKGVRVHVPWLDVDLAGGSQLLQAGQGSGGGHLVLSLSGNAPARTFGPVTLDANALQFGTLKGVGWAVQAQSTLFSFEADGKQFAKDVAVQDLKFGMDGKAYFDASGGSAHVGLSGAQGQLAQGVVDLESLDVVATPGATSRLLFNFSTELRISDALPAAPAPVSYRIDEASTAHYTGSGPVTGDFVIHKPFPDANPSTDSVIHPDYVGPQNGQSAAADPGGWLIANANAAGSGHMTYCGDVDLGMFGGPPVKGGFALGYQGTDDFWAARADVTLGPSGTPLVPPFMTLYVVGGGLGYNITLDSFASGSSCDVSASINHTPAFNAHLQVGDPSHFVYGFDGEFTVEVSGPQAGARMDYKAWLARNDWGDGGDFNGHFLFANGSFDGTLNGHYGFLDNQVYIEAANDAIAMHFGGGQWYIHAGTEPNPVKGHVLIVNAGAWLGLGSDGLYAGAKAHLDEGAGDCGDVCARVTSDTVLQAKLTTEPHISADAGTSFDAHACAFDICLGAGVGGSMHVAALPPELGFGFRLGGCPPGHLDVGLDILPSPEPHIGGGVCLW
jgi:hypothetical protein